MMTLLLRFERLRGNQRVTDRVVARDSSSHHQEEPLLPALSRCADPDILKIPSAEFELVSLSFPSQ